MTSPPDPLSASLAEVRESLDLPPGVGMAVMRLPQLDPLIERLEDEVGRESSFGTELRTILCPISASVACAART